MINLISMKLYKNILKTNFKINHQSKIQIIRVFLYNINLIFLNLKKKKKNFFSHLSLNNNKTYTHAIIDRFVSNP